MSDARTESARDWSQYGDVPSPNDALVERGRLTLWITDEAVDGWVYDGPPQ
jgi:hypothetical protein